MGNVSDGEGNVCVICGKKNIEIISDNHNDPLNFYRCPECGGYFAPSAIHYDFCEEEFNKKYDVNKLKSYLFYHKKGRPIFDIYEALKGKEILEYKNSYLLAPEIVENWYPKTFAEKIDKILLYFDSRTNYMGEVKSYKFLELTRIFMLNYDEKTFDRDFMGSEQFNQIYYYLDFLKAQNYISDDNMFVSNRVFQYWESDYDIQLTPAGLARIDELQKSVSNNKNVFVSMAFNEKTKDTREAIRNGIAQAGFSPEFIDEIIHNHQIVPEMLRLIRECRFLILDITDPNFGAYYEAGYASGLGKEIIVCCKREVFENKDFICDKDNACKYYSKAMRPHFDIVQKQILVWDNCADLSKKLSEWIKALFNI